MENVSQALEEPFLTIETFRYDDDSKRIPWIVGINSEEGAMFTQFIYDDNDTMISEWEDQMPQLLGYDHLNKSEQVKISAEIKEFYFGDRTLNQSSIENVTNVSRLCYLT